METVAIAALATGVAVGGMDLIRSRSEGKAMAKQYENEAEYGQKQAKVDAELAEKRADIDIEGRSRELTSVLNQQAQWFASRGGDIYSGSAAAAASGATAAAGRDTRLIRANMAQEQQTITGNAALNARQLRYASKVKKNESRYAMLTGALNLGATAGLGGYATKDFGLWSGLGSRTPAGSGSGIGSGNAAIGSARRTTAGRNALYG